MKFLTDTIEDFLIGLNATQRILAVLILGFIALFAFEMYTAHFSLKRKNEETQILKSLVELSPSKELTEQEEEIRKRILVSLEPNEFKFISFSRSNITWPKFFWGMSPYLALGLLMAFSGSSTGNIPAVGFLSIFGIFHGIICSLIPGQDLFTIAVLIPWGTLFCFTLVGVLIGVAFTKKKSDKQEKNVS